MNSKINDTAAFPPQVSSFVSVAGVVKGEVKYSTSQGIRFIIKSANGSMFSIRGHEPFRGSRVDEIKPGRNVLVWGRLTSSMSRVCHHHHTHIWPYVIVLLADSGFPTLIKQTDLATGDRIFPNLLYPVH